MNTTGGSSCLTCGGLIMEPGRAYGYAGPVCRCLVEPKIQRPSHQSINIVPGAVPFVPHNAKSVVLEEIIAQHFRIYGYEKVHYLKEELEKYFDRKFDIIE